MDIFDALRSQGADLTAAYQQQQRQSLYANSMNQLLNNAWYPIDPFGEFDRDKLTLAKQYAAEVRLRKPQMQVARITERDKAG